MLDAIETPAVIVDERRLRANIERMQSLADAQRLALRPHAKTHKSITVARIQLDAGAVGLTVSKSEEAAALGPARAPSVTVAYPLVDRRKLERLRSLARHTAMRIVVDSIECVERLVEAATDGSFVPEVVIEIDVGLGRCGVPPASDALLGLARSVVERGLCFSGILSHAGHAYAAASGEELAAIAEQERRAMVASRAALERAGIPTPVVSVGATPTVHAARSFDGIDEIRPGNYVFLDRIQIGLGVCTIADVALSVLTTIVGRNGRHYIVDAGSKTLSSDRGAHGNDGPGGFGEAFVEEVAAGATRLSVARLSEEHGFVERGTTNLPIGARVRIVPNHACPVANLARTLVLVTDDEVREVEVDARASVR